MSVDWSRMYAFVECLKCYIHVLVFIALCFYCNSYLCFYHLYLYFNWRGNVFIYHKTTTLEYPYHIVQCTFMCQIEVVG